MSRLTVISRTWVMAQKEMLHIRRDPQVLAFSLVLPVAMLLLFGYAISFDLENIPLVVVDEDHSVESRALVQHFSSGDLFHVVDFIEDPADVDAHFRRNQASAAIVIPRGYAKGLVRLDGATLQLIADGSDNNSTAISIGYATAMVNAATLANAPAALTPPLRLQVSARALFNPQLKSAIFIVPGLIALIPAMVAVMMTALTVAREFERGSMEQLFSTPVGRVEIVLGKLLPYLVLGLIQVALIVVVGVLLFGVPFEGSLLVLLGVSTVFLMAVLMQGLVISIVTRSQVLASQVALITTLLPTLLLSGFIFPLENMPLPLRVLATILPSSHFMWSLRAIVLRGNGWAEVALPTLAVFAYFCFMTAVAVRRFRRSTN